MVLYVIAEQLGTWEAAGQARVCMDALRLVLVYVM